MGSVCVDSFGWVTGSVSGIEEEGGGRCRCQVYLCLFLWMSKGLFKCRMEDLPFKVARSQFYVTNVYGILNMAF
jgi:hypothetical protein